MSSIEQAIAQLETTAEKLKEITKDESKAVTAAVRNATKEATAKVKAEYAEKKKAARKENREAEKAVKEAQLRIQKALGTGQTTSTRGRRAKRGERERQFVEYVKANPGSKLSEIARGIGIQNSPASTLSKKAIAAGKVKKSKDKTYTAA